MVGFQWKKKDRCFQESRKTKKMQVYELLAICKLNNEQKQMFLRIM